MAEAPATNTTTTTTTTAPATATAEPGEGSPPRRGTTLAFIALVAALFVTMFSVLWYRSWWKQPAAASARFVVQGGAEHEGMLIHIEGDRLSAPLEARIAKEQDYVVAFSLPAGSYTIRITLDGRLYYEQRGFYLHEHHLAHLPLKVFEEARRKAASRPASQRRP